MWTRDISSMIFTRVKVSTEKKLKEKYPNIYFTTSDKTQTEPKFPSVYIHEVGSIEQGQDIDNTDINAVLSTFQVDVTDNQSQNRAKDVMDEIMKSMKAMRFTVSSMPSFNNTESTYRQTARFRRMIGQGDIL